MNGGSCLSVYDYMYGVCRPVCTYLLWQQYEPLSPKRCSPRLSTPTFSASTQYHDSFNLLVTHGVNPNTAVTPVNTINGPYPVAYAVLPPPPPPRVPKIASLTGPQSTFPTPLPAPSSPIILPRSYPVSKPLISRRTPAYVAVQPPAKKPQTILKAKRVGRVVAKPQRRKTERAEPRAEIRTTWVTGRRSERAERAMTPGTVAVLRIETVREAVRGSAFWACWSSVRWVKDGR